MEADPIKSLIEAGGVVAAVEAAGIVRALPSLARGTRRSQANSGRRIRRTGPSFPGAAELAFARLRATPPCRRAQSRAPGAQRRQGLTLGLTMVNFMSSPAAVALSRKPAAPSRPAVRQASTRGDVRALGNKRFPWLALRGTNTTYKRSGPVGSTPPAVRRRRGGPRISEWAPVLHCTACGGARLAQCAGS